MALRAEQQPGVVVEERPGPEAPLEDEPNGGVVQRTAWKMLRTSTRRFFLLLTAVVASTVALTSAVAVVVAASNADAVADARTQGEQVATAITEFRDHLSQADDEVAATLVTGSDTLSPLSRARYQAELLASSLALTRAGLVATGENATRIRMLAADLDRFATLVETARAYPVGTRYHRDARALVRDDLVPLANRTRASAEAQIEHAADEVAGWRTTAAIVGLVLAIVTAALVVTLVAGRTRIRLHPAFVAALALLLVELAVVSRGLWTERDELEAAAGADLEAYGDAQEAASTIFDLRGRETDAVAELGDVEEIYAEFAERADDLIAAGSVPGRPASDAEAIAGAVSEYADRVEEVRTADEAATVEATFEGQSAIAYRSARGLAVSTVSRSTNELTAQLDEAADAGVSWLAPLLLGGVAALLAAGGVLRRGQAYRVRLS